MVPRTIAGADALRSASVGIRPVILALHDVAARGRLEIAHDLGEAEHAHRDRRRSRCRRRVPGCRTSCATAPVSMSVPTSESSRPNRIIAIALSTEPLREHDREDEAEHHQREVFRRAELQRDARSAARRAPRPGWSRTQPAKNEPIAAIASAGPARPCFAIWWPSSVVTTEDDSPGMLTRIAWSSRHTARRSRCRRA